MIEWTCYLVECKDGTYYCGVTTDLDRRMKEHNEGRGARYTRGRNPVKLIVSVQGLSKVAAYQLEARVKKAHRNQKEQLIQSKDYPTSLCNR